MGLGAFAKWLRSRCVALMCPGAAILHQRLVIVGVTAAPVPVASVHLRVKNVYAVVHGPLLDLFGCSCELCGDACPVEHEVPKRIGARLSNLVSAKDDDAAAEVGEPLGQASRKRVPPGEVEEGPFGRYTANVCKEIVATRARTSSTSTCPPRPASGTAKRGPHVQGLHGATCYRLLVAS